MEDLTARSGQDYLTQSGTVNFTSPSSGLIHVDIFENPFWSGSRMFRLRLFDPGETVVLGHNRVATIIIRDDDTVLGPRRGMEGQIQAVLAVPENKWMIGGDFIRVDGYRRNRIARLENDGVLDPTFDPATGANGPVYAIARQPDGKLIVAGAFTTFAGTDRPFIVRLTGNGELDTTFASLISAANLESAPESSVIRSLLIQPDKKILVVGIGLKAGNSLNTGVVRLHPDGAVDADFFPPVTLTNANFVELQQDGKLVVSGQFGTDYTRAGSSLIRLNPNGSRDPAFLSDLAAVRERGVRNVLALTTRANGQILVGGLPIYSEGNLGLLVLDPSGRPAREQISIQINGKPVKDGGVFGMAWQSSDHLLIAGGWSVPSINGGSIRGLAVVRINSNLTQDLGFTSTLGLGFVQSPTVLQDGKVGGLGFGPKNLGILRSDGVPVQDLHFTGIAQLPDSQFHLALRGYSPFRQVLQVSSDLLNWQTIANSASELQGLVFKETIATNELQRFYRVVRQP